ncbi:hypothetical protein E5163_01255 [Marinicauda algicola]|uniref:Uncharacterized protein n=1 Tax=Marinicauda algicola TaxID=2029849 RepID=A0A4S2H2H7_9PROT|nr:hypothetical protein [Marinicauda algicola]TGY89797.1 hypothetical protein E5163_01255 [Marinicauda algicola]
MPSITRLASWAAALFISAIFIDSLRFKFTGHETPRHIFTTLRDWSGIDLFYPAGPWIIGLAELAAALLLVVLPALVVVTRGREAHAALSQSLGALIAIGVMSGAIVFHLFTPLGIETPTAWQDAQPVETSPALFVAAVVSWLCAGLILLLRGPLARRTLTGRATDGALS